MADLVGHILQGRYRIEGLVGRGGMAEVYKAWDTWRNYYVAVKVMREDLAGNREFDRCFQREAEALFRLAHQHGSLKRTSPGSWQRRLENVETQ